MSRKPGNIPAYSHHRASGQSIVRLSGCGHYLGPHDSPESREKYDRLIAEWLANGRQSVETTEASCEGLLIKELLLKFVDQAESYYVDVVDGKQSAEVANLKIAIRPVKLLYGRSFAKAFGPNALKAVRQHMVDVQDLSRREVNKRIGRIKRVFRWAATCRNGQGREGYTMTVNEQMIFVPFPHFVLPTSISEYRRNSAGRAGSQRVVRDA